MKNQRTQENPAGFLGVFDRRLTDTSNFDPFEPYPARFISLEAALDALQSYIDRDPSQPWSIYDGALEIFVEGGAEMPIPKLNPFWENSPFELRIRTAGTF